MIEDCPTGPDPRCRCVKPSVHVGGTACAAGPPNSREVCGDLTHLNILQQRGDRIAELWRGQWQRKVGLRDVVLLTMSDTVKIVGPSLIISDGLVVA
jgi:hypothetical protein